MRKAAATNNGDGEDFRIRQGAGAERSLMRESERLKCLPGRLGVSEEAASRGLKAREETILETRGMETPMI